MEAIKLTDEQMRGFIRDGYVAVNPDLPADFHQEVWDQTDAVFESEGNPGNNLIARVPAIQQVFDDPAVDGALTGVLGPNYYMHPHRHCHYRPPRSEGQQIHKDSFTKRRHRARWLLAMYYPQKTTVDMGPTAIIPGSHYYNWLRGPIRVDRHFDGTEGEVPMAVEAGTVLLVHYDIWHRGMANVTDKKRYMIKIMFTRMEEPDGPSWDNERPEWVADDGDGLGAKWEHTWRWHYGANDEANGANGPSASTIPGLIAGLRVDSESACLDAAYNLATIGPPAVPALIDTLGDDAEAVRRNASYALTAIGGPAVEPLVEAAGSGPDTRAMAVETLADMGPDAREAVPFLTTALQDESVDVRRHAADALGTSGQSTSAGIGPLAQALSDEDERVRRNAALSLARIGRNAEEATPALKAALKDDDRYVRGKAAEALRRIGTAEAQEALLDFLMTSRWCHTTTKDSLY